MCQSQHVAISVLEGHEVIGVLGVPVGQQERNHRTHMCGAVFVDLLEGQEVLGVLGVPAGQPECDHSTFLCITVVVDWLEGQVFMVLGVPIGHEERNGPLVVT